MRPGSVIHTQQAYLVKMESFMASGAKFKGEMQPYMPLFSPLKSTKYSIFDDSFNPQFLTPYPYVAKGGDQPKPSTLNPQP